MIEFELGELRGTVVRSGNVDFNNRTDTYRFSTTRDVTDFFLQSTSTGATVEVDLYQDINGNGLIDRGEFVDDDTVGVGQFDYIDKNLGRSSYLVEVSSDSQGRSASYTLRFGNLADDVVGLSSPSSQPFVSGTISVENPYDLYAFNTSTTGKIELSARGTTETIEVDLYEDVNKNRQLDAPDSFIDDDSVGSGQVDLISRTVGAGDFLIQVSPPSGGRSTNYELSLSGPAGADLRSNNSSSASSGTVYRVYDFLTGAHFYTANASERNTRITDGRYRDEGASFDSAGVNTVERFYNPTTQTYFYTINPAERDAVLNSLPNYQYEPGQGFQASAAPVPGFTPLYRFFNTLNGVHFYTPNAAEAQNVRDTLPNFRDEGVGFYVDPLG